MSTVIFYKTVVIKGEVQQRVMGRVRHENEQLAIDPAVRRLTDWLLREVDRRHPVEVEAALQSAPEHFDGGYVRASYEANTP